MKNRFIFFFLLTALTISLSWKAEEKMNSNSRDKKVRIFSAELTIPAEWVLVKDDEDILLLAGNDTLRFMRNVSFVPMHILGVEFTGHEGDTSHAAWNRKIRAQNDSIIKADPRVLTHCEKKITPPDSGYVCYAIYPCKNEPGKLSMEFWEQPTGDLIGMSGTKVSPARATELMEIISSFRYRKKR